MNNEDYHSTFPFSHRSKKTVYKFHPFTPKKEIDNVLNSSNTYTLYKEHRKPKHHIPTITHGKRFLFQADTIFMSNDDKIVSLNKGFKYILAIIDCFTRYAWTFPLKNIKCATVIECFNKLFSQTEKPLSLYTDRGNEFKCKEFKSFMKQEGINHYFSYSVRKCSIVERFNLSIQKLIYKKCREKRSSKWIDFLDDCMTIYLTAPHSAIGNLSPTEGEMSENQVKIGRVQCKTKNHKRKLKPKYSKGATVRIWAHKTSFKRGYHQNFTEEYFKIKKVLTNLPGPPRYVLEDLKGEEIKGNFTEDEITPYTPSAETYFEIEKILKERGKGANKEFYVKFVGFDSRFNQWVKDIV